MYWQIAAPLLAGLAVFLFGLKIMEYALNRWAGPYLKDILERFTGTPLRGMVTGTAITALLQSSSAVTVITIGLVNAGVITFPRTLGIILGTNIGTCITTELIGLNLNRLAIPLLIGTAAVWFASLAVPKEKIRSVKGRRLLLGFRCLSLAVGGFACILIGMLIMQTIVPTLQTYGLLGWFAEQAQRSLLWGLFAGMALTAAIQSGAATIAIAMGLASVEAITVELGIAIVLGANVGTCSTALLASIGSNRYGRAVAWSHIILNMSGAALFLPLVSLLSDVSAALSGNPSGQIAHAQTLFNIACSLLALPICYLPALRAVDRKPPAV